MPFLKHRERERERERKGEGCEWREIKRESEKGEYIKGGKLER